MKKLISIFAIILFSSLALKGLSSESQMKPGQEDSKGVEGVVNVVELPEPFEGDDPVAEAKRKKNYPFDPDALRAEEESILSRVKKGKSAIAGNIPYYKVKFRFNQLRRVRTEIKHAVNKESEREKPDQKKIFDLMDTLKNYNEDRVKAVYVTGTFNEWKVNQHNMKKLDNGVYETVICVPEGKHYYKFAIDTGLDGKEFFLIKDHNATNFETDTNGNEFAVIQVPGSDIDEDENKKMVN